MPEAVFGDIGNYEDYWLGTPAYDRQPETGWFSVESLLRTVNKQEAAAWSTSLDEAAALMSEQAQGGGLTGVHSDYFDILRAVVKSGERAAAEERRFDRLGMGKRGRL